MYNNRYQLYDFKLFFSKIPKCCFNLLYIYAFMLLRTYVWGMSFINLKNTIVMCRIKAMYTHVYLDFSKVMYTCIFQFLYSEELCIYLLLFSSSDLFWSTDANHTSVCPSYIFIFFSRTISAKLAKKIHRLKECKIN